jgi:hypothetical protein
MRAEERGLIPVLLLFYDLDPAGIKITETFRKGLRDIIGATGWNPQGLIIDRIGLNAVDVDRYGLTWIENLKTGSGRESKDREYIQKYGRRKCESNALFKNDYTLQVGEKICRNAIEKYYGKDALKRFRQKEVRSKEKYNFIYDSPIWENLNENLDKIINSISFNTTKEDDKIDNKKNTPPPSKFAQMEEVEVKVNNEHYGICPICQQSFDYDLTDVGHLFRCRSCHTTLRIKYEN